MQPSILGRVQDISDTFDNDWATKLSEQGQRPWVTLLFHIDGDPAYMSSLPAITNGVYDKYLKQWALSIREYGKPLYLTILPHVDRNWSLSSAVTNGGIPQDVPLAWKHVRQIFADLQADNVAWVWAPADPTHDELYAPYPQTEWVDPHKALQAVEVRYPDMPLFVEVSAAGQPVDKAAWLQQVGVAVASEANVRALLYHDGSPYTKSTMQQHQLWSVASDILSMDAAKSMIKIADLQTLSAEIHLPDPSHKMYSPID